MPYTRKQCKLFFVKKKRGEKVPRDFRSKCRKPETVISERKS